MPTPSPNDTVVLAGSGGTIIDSAGNKWTISPQLQVLENGLEANYTANVVEIAYVNSVVWHENTSGQWYSWNGSQWIAGANPMPSPAAQILTMVQQILTTLPTLATKQEIQALSDVVQQDFAQLQSMLTGVASNITQIQADEAVISTNILALEAEIQPDTLTPAAQTALNNLIAAGNSLSTNAAQAQSSLDSLAKSSSPQPAPAPAPAPAPSA